MNVFELLNLVVFFNVFAFRYLAMTSLKEVVEAESFGSDDEFVDLRTFGIYSQTSTNLIAFNALLSFCKMFKYLQFHRGLNQASPVQPSLLPFHLLSYARPL
jgi:hypothetical protein